MDPAVLQLFVATSYSRELALPPPATSTSALLFLVISVAVWAAGALPGRFATAVNRSAIGSVAS